MQLQSSSVEARTMENQAQGINQNPDHSLPGSTHETNSKILYGSTGFTVLLVIILIMALLLAIYYAGYIYCRRGRKGFQRLHTKRANKNNFYAQTAKLMTSENGAVLLKSRDLSTEIVSDADTDGTESAGNSNKIEKCHDGSSVAIELNGKPGNSDAEQPSEGLSVPSSTCERRLRGYWGDSLNEVVAEATSLSVPSNTPEKRLSGYWGDSLEETAGETSIRQSNKSTVTEHIADIFKEIVGNGNWVVRHNGVAKGFYGEYILGVGSGDFSSGAGVRDAKWSDTIGLANNGGGHAKANFRYEYGGGSRDRPYQPWLHPLFHATADDS